MYTRGMVEVFLAQHEGLEEGEADEVLSRVNDVASVDGMIPALGLSHIFGVDSPLLTAFCVAWESGKLIGAVPEQ